MRFFIKKLLSANLVLAVFLFFALLSQETVLGAFSPASVEYEKARKSYHALLQSKKKMERRDHWLLVIKKFDLVYRVHFSSKEAYKAVFTIGDLYEQLYAISRWEKDRNKALKYYQKTIDEFKHGRLTDDALYRQGEIYFSREKYTVALTSFQKILKIFPGGDVVVKAKARAADTKTLIRAHSKTKTVSPEIKKLSVRLKENLNVKKSKKSILKKVDYTVGSDSVRVVTHTSSPITFSQGRLSKPERVYINFKDTRLAINLVRNIQIGSRFLKGLRLSHFDDKDSRLVFDLNKVNNLKIGVWQENSDLIVELSDKSIQKKRISVKPEAHLTQKNIKNSKKVKLNSGIRKPVGKISKQPTIRKVDRKVPIIVIDAGHGGKDLGAKGHNGLLEKDVNLAIALRLKDILESQYKYRVILTRKDDKFIPLPGRGKIANENNADVFISVHANAAPRRSAHGIETYYLGTGHSEQAKETAIRENGGLVKSVKDNQTQEILASMISTTKINKSARLASNVQNQLYQSMRKKYSRIKNLGVKEGPFFVLHDTNMASVLVEVGFLTNRKEENYLRKSSYQDKLAFSIAKGVLKFIHESDPMI